MVRRKRIPYDPPSRRGKGKSRHRSIPRADQLFMSRRMFVARAGIVGAFSVLAARLGFMQLFREESYKAEARSNIRRAMTIKPTRGLIYDRQGRELAKNDRAWEVRLDPDKLPPEDSPERGALINELVNSLNLPNALVLNPNDVPKGAEAMVYARSAQLLGKATLAVTETDQLVQQPPLTPPGQVIEVNGDPLIVWIYPGAAERTDEAAAFRPDGSAVDGTTVEWAGTPHFFFAGNVLAVLLCDNVNLITAVKQAIDRLPDGAGSRTLTSADVANELRRAGLASWSEYIERESGYGTLVRLEDELTVDQAALFRAHLPEMPGVKVISQLEYRIANNPPGQQVIVKTGVPREVALKLEANRAELPGVELDANVLVRRYPGGESMSHILGYAGKISESERNAKENLNNAGNFIYQLDDTIGKDGLERVVEPTLRGQAGLRWVEVDAVGAERRVIKETAALPGRNVGLTIDLEFQRAVAEILRLGIEFSNADRRAAEAQDPNKALKKESGAGSVVALDPRSGEVLAMVSYPHYDNQLFVDGISTRKFKEYISKERNQPLLDRALRGAYPPGSTLKPFLAAAGLEEGTLKNDTKFVCSGGIQVPYAWNEAKGTKHPCWLTSGHEELDVLGAIERSCDVFFYNVGAPKAPIDENNPQSEFLHYRDLQPDSGQLGERHYFGGLGIGRINTELETKFWFGEKTGIELPTEEPGVVPDPVWLSKADPNANWSVSATINVSIGQGYFLTTPLQLALNVAALANGGTVHRPHLVRETFDDQRSRIDSTKPAVLRKLGIKKEHVATVREGMRRVVGSPNGTAYATRGRTKWPLTNPDGQPEIKLAGKTGTAEVGLPDEATGKYESQHAWFTCFGPFDKPEIAIAVVLEDGGEGASYAVPVADRVMRAYFELTKKRSRGVVLRPDGDKAATDAPVLAGTAAFPTPGEVIVESVD
jgi:penicillin-binding protein 2